jgi:hypothetical protein
LKPIRVNQINRIARQIGEKSRKIRNTEMDLKEGIDRLPPATSNHLEFDFEEDTLP